MWRYINRDFAKWTKESNITITQKASEKAYQMQRRETGAEKKIIITENFQNCMKNINPHMKESQLTLSRMNERYSSLD